MWWLLTGRFKVGEAAKSSIMDRSPLRASIGVLALIAVHEEDDSSVVALELSYIATGRRYGSTGPDGIRRW
jgi:hypothetical protein